MPVKLSDMTDRYPTPAAGVLPKALFWLAAGAAALSLSLGTLTTAHAESSDYQTSGEPALTITLPPPGSVPSPIPASGSTSPTSAGLPPPDFQHLSVRAIGQVNQDGAQLVRRAGSATMQVLYTCPAGQNVGIVGQIGEWYCVMMADNSLGCILAERVNLVWQRSDGDTSEPVDRGANSSTSWQHTAPARVLELDHASIPSRLSVPSTPHLNLSAISSPVAGRVIESAMKYIGTPYVWGGNTAGGIDCSGLVKAVFSQEGIELPRTAREQAEVGSPVTLAEIQPGDRLSFACHSSSVDHTAIYVGNGQFIHASGGRGQVCISKLEGPYLRWLVAIHRDTKQ